jgi:hypothetical protein
MDGPLPQHDKDHEREKHAPHCGSSWPSAPRSWQMPLDEHERLDSRPPAHACSRRRREGASALFRTARTKSAWSRCSQRRAATPAIARASIRRGEVVRGRITDGYPLTAPIPMTGDSAEPPRTRSSSRSSRSLVGEQNRRDSTGLEPVFSEGYVFATNFTGLEDGGLMKWMCH